MRLGRLFDRRARRRQKAALVLYEHIRDVSRDPVLYRPGRVPDTLDGRFTILVVHLALVIRRLQREGAAARAFSQDLFEHFIHDMDQGMREAAVGDLAVPKRLKKMMRVWYGHLRAMDEELQPADERGELMTVLPGFLQRNLYKDAEEVPDLRPLAAYVHGQWRAAERLTWGAFDAPPRDLAERLAIDPMLPRPHEEMFEEVTA